VKDGGALNGLNTETEAGGIPLPGKVEVYLTSVSRRLTTALGDNLVGTYLHGSAVLGGYNPARSDLDVLVVARGPLSEDDKQNVGEQLLSDAAAVPADTLELSVITLSTAQDVTGSPNYELHVNTRDRRWADGSGRSDPDLILHLPIVRQSGRILGHGPQAVDVVSPVNRALVLQEMCRELLEAPLGPFVAPEYLVLNACRNRAYLREGRFFSKVEGGRWVLDHETDVDPRTVEAAIRRQDGSDSAAPLSHDEAAGFARNVAGGIQAELRNLQRGR
jgi:hypothetical protein